ncbi:hypothetical protein KSP39_PZI021618 [Platanthera zijinensis]|uniref:AB hydrolase-1 domain-containing protein n=1 Tax=Platanthera zijinensis TaxID=2320716 RepID=A0AAP0FVY5_9ASPA
MGGAKEAVISAASFLVFAFLDLLDFCLCFFYMFVDSVLEDNPAPCFCRNRGAAEQGMPGVDHEGNGEISETLYERRSMFRLQAVFCSNKEEGVVTKEKEKKMCRRRPRRLPRWSDCSCETCFSLPDWAGKKPEKLYFVIKETNPAAAAQVQDLCQNVIFLHGFLSSSSFWVDSVFPNISQGSNTKVKMFAVDLLGFGRSPKPVNCSYTIRDQLEGIYTSVIKEFKLGSFHIVAHSMGCILALALAAEFPDSVKSITLVAPPYFSSLEDKASHNVLNRIAERKIWPPLLFGCSVMSWYEHLGRTICFLFCRNHSMWEGIMKLLMWKGQLPSSMLDLTKHTHQSAWHTMHNVVCGGAKVMDKYLKTLKGEDILIKIIQGSKDQVVPLECSYNMKGRFPQAELQIIHNADHTTVILDRKKDFTRDLEEIWSTSSLTHKH